MKVNDAALLFGRALFSRLTGAGLVLLGWYLFLLVNSTGPIDWYEPVQQLSPRPMDGSYPMAMSFSITLWPALYMYGLLSSLAMGAAGYYWPKLRGTGMQLLLHGAAGFFTISYLLRFPLPSGLPLALIAGGIGVLCAVIFYGGFRLGQISLWARVLLGLVMPLLLISVNLLLPQGMSRDWTEQRTSGSYTATYSYWDGIRPITIDARAGETIEYRIEHEAQAGTKGIAIQGTAGMETDYSTDGNSSSDVPPPERGYAGRIHVKKDGEFTIIVSGDNMRDGRLTVSWTIRPTDDSGEAGK